MDNGPDATGKRAHHLQKVRSCVSRDKASMSIADGDLYERATLPEMIEEVNRDETVRNHVEARFGKDARVTARVSQLDPRPR